MREPEPGPGPESEPEPTLTRPCDVAHVINAEHSEFAMQLFSAGMPTVGLLGNANKTDAHVVLVTHVCPSGPHGGDAEHSISTEYCPSELCHPSTTR